MLPTAENDSRGRGFLAGLQTDISMLLTLVRERKHTEGALAEWKLRVRNLYNAYHTWDGVMSWSDGKVKLLKASQVVLVSFLAV